MPFSPHYSLFGTFLMTPVSKLYMPSCARLICFARNVMIGILVSVAGFVGISFSLGECHASWTEGAQHEVWSICLEQEINSQRAEKRNVQLVLIQNRTQSMRPFVALLWPLALKSQVSERRLPALRTITLASYLLGNLRSHSVRQRLTISAPYRLADTEAIYDHGQIPQRLFPQSLGYIVLSEVGFSADRTQALLHMDHMCGLCGHGEDVLLRKMNGQWVIEATASSWIS
jgi:hypothetical protein